MPTLPSLLSQPCLPRFLHAWRAALPVLALAVLILGVPGQAHAGKTLDGIRQRGQLACGVSTGVAGFSAPDSKGRWAGLDQQQRSLGRLTEELTSRELTLRELGRGVLLIPRAR